MPPRPRYYKELGRADEVAGSTILVVLDNMDPRAAPRRRGTALLARSRQLQRVFRNNPEGFGGGRCRSGSECPRGGGARVGKVGAIGAGADRTVEMIARLGMVLTDPGYRLADRAGDGDAGTLGGGCGSSIATT